VKITSCDTIISWREETALFGVALLICVASRICDISHHMDHMVRFPRPSPLCFAYCKQSKTGGVEGLPP